MTAGTNRTGLGWLALAVLVFAGLTALLTAAGFVALARLAPAMLRGAGLGAEPAQVVLMLGSFALPGAALLLVWRLIYGQGPGALTGPPRRALRQFGTVLAVAAPLAVFALVLPNPDLGQPVPNLAPAIWLAWLVPGLVALLVQVSVEEAVFRGFLQNRMAARFRSRVLWLGLPALIFGVMHFDPRTVETAPFLIGIATLFGLIAGDLTARSGTLGPAIALHLVNNFLAIFCVSLGGGLSGLALYLYPEAPDGGALAAQAPAEALMLAILWLAARIALRR
ncbi:CPBP family intramembrane glutamic endopeptidase [Pseudooceanicola aestuarii]|uniref:CPBP family intramembrane glutamic endopeptidase n=1 Tax=Pseudooceanicola aestuarii TaxID=2697319 RepID=UPI0013D1956A|nr:type II CAAX endopeptidase family protein [Pseudooceanicola aestuarii]